MKILIACEYSGITREAFKRHGHDAWSCDILPSEIPGQHLQTDVRNILNLHWDMMIAHPPCTHLAVSGARWFSTKSKKLQEEALQLIKDLMNAPIPRIAIENPVSIISTQIKKPTQIIQPYEYGEPVTKKTCLWLKNLPKLKPTLILKHYEPTIHKMPPGPNRAKERSRSFHGIANAMAKQWSNTNNIYTQLTLNL